MGSMDEFRRPLLAGRVGSFSPLIDSAFPLDEVPAAFARLEAPARMGNILIRIP